MGLFFFDHVSAARPGFIARRTCAIITSKEYSILGKKGSSCARASGVASGNGKDHTLH